VEKWTRHFIEEIMDKI